MMVRDISAILQVCHSIFAVLRIIVKPNVIFFVVVIWWYFDSRWWPLAYIAMFCSKTKQKIQKKKNNKCYLLMTLNFTGADLTVFHQNMCFHLRLLCLFFSFWNVYIMFHPSLVNGNKIHKKLKTLSSCCLLIALINIKVESNCMAFKSIFYETEL